MIPQAHAALARRLDSGGDRPVAVAVSGGGDSLAALLVTHAWARAAGRPVVALTVDHRLQPQSGEWTRFVSEASARLGVRFRALAWTGTQPATGLPAAARLARHQLLADAAREEGAAVIVTGHTADDVRENALLGQGRLSEWSPSPVWPHGRGIFLLRPLLEVDRSHIRTTLLEHGERWIDDPANDDLRQPRARARRSKAAPDLPSPAPSIAALAENVAFDDGVFRFGRALITDAPDEQALRLLGAALVCAGGGERPPRKERLAALLQRLRSPISLNATLTGALLIAEEDVLIGRNAGEAARGGLRPLSLATDETGIWDGRVQITARAPVRIAPLRGHASKLDPDQRRALALVSAAYRPAQPLVIISEDGRYTLEPNEDVAKLQDLVWPRFLSACDAIAQESELARGAHGATRTGVLCSSPVTK